LIYETAQNIETKILDYMVPVGGVVTIFGSFQGIPMGFTLQAVGEMSAVGV